MRPIPPVQLGDRTYESIRAAIVTGELVPGQSLVDRRLADELQVSRTPVREALHRLEADGLVQPRGRAGWEVTDFTEQDVHELFQLRMLLEPVGIDTLAKAPDDALVARVATFFDGYEHPIAGDRYEDYVARDRAFHELLVACSGNRRLQRFYTVIGSHIDRGRHFLTGSADGRADDTLDEHRAVAAAVSDRDFARARDALLRHLRTGEELMVRQLRQVRADQERQ
jgi:DNA-binding GntR family transcriptional regulator